MGEFNDWLYLHNTPDLVYAFKDLPVIYIDDYGKLNKSFLKNLDNYKFEKLYADYWIEGIRKVQKIN